MKSGFIANLCLRTRRRGRIFANIEGSQGVLQPLRSGCTCRSRFLRKLWPSDDRSEHRGVQHGSEKWPSLRLGAFLRSSANRRWFLPSVVAAAFLESAVSKCTSNDDNRGRCRTAFGLWTVEAYEMGFIFAYDGFCRRSRLLDDGFSPQPF